MQHFSSGATTNPVMPLGVIPMAASLQCLMGFIVQHSLSAEVAYPHRIA